MPGVVDTLMLVVVMIIQNGSSISVCERESVGGGKKAGKRKKEEQGDERRREENIPEKYSRGKKITAVPSCEDKIFKVFINFNREIIKDKRRIGWIGP